MSRPTLPFPARFDFAEIKRRVSVEEVLAARGLLEGLRRRGDRLTGPCPIHGGDNPTAFVVDCRKGVWFCFSRCRRGGDVIELMRLLDGVSHREAASRLAVLTPSPHSPHSPPIPEQRTPSFRPFERTLYLDPHEPWLEAKQISAATARAYEAGTWSGGGMLAGCVAVRLHSSAGAPLGYAGRRLHGEGSKWVFPPAFPKGVVLYGHHRVAPSAPALVVVECPWGVMRLAQIGVAAVALLGTSMSERQAELLSRRQRITLLLDGDAAGRRAAGDLTRRLELAVDVRTVDLPHGCDPDDLVDEELTARLAGVI